MSAKSKILNNVKKANACIDALVTKRNGRS